MNNTDLRSVHFSEVRDRIAGNRQIVWASLLRCGPATCTELAAAMHWDKCSVRPRICDLRGAFHVVETGRRRNGEHEFRALTEVEAEEYHSHARALWLNAEATTEQLGLQIV